MFEAIAGFLIEVCDFFMSPFGICKQLLANAKTAKHAIEHRFGDIFARDFAESLDGTPQVNCPKVEGEAIANCGLDLLQGGLGAGEGGGLALVDGEV